MSGFPPARLCLRVLSVTWKQGGLLTRDSGPTWHPSTHCPLLPPSTRPPLGTQQQAASLCWLGGSLHGVRCSFASRLGRGSPGGKLQGGGSHVGKSHGRCGDPQGGEEQEWSDLGCPASLDLEEVPRKGQEQVCILKPAGVWEPGGPVGGTGHLASFAPGGRKPPHPAFSCSQESFQGLCPSEFFNRSWAGCWCMVCV